MKLNTLLFAPEDCDNPCNSQTARSVHVIVVFTLALIGSIFLAFSILVRCGVVVRFIADLTAAPATLKNQISVR